MNIFNFGKDMKAEHIEAHKRNDAIFQNLYDDLVQKYGDKLNCNGKKTEKYDEDDKKSTDVDEDEAYKCRELIDFCENKMVLMFKKHAFEYDSLYIDKLGDDDPSIEIKTEKH
eukprot:UN07376